MLSPVGRRVGAYLPWHDVIARFREVPPMRGHIDADRGQALGRTLDALQVTT